MYIIALLAALWHLGWVFILWNASGPMMATPIAPYYLVFTTSRQVAVMLLTISLLVMLGKVKWKRGWLFLGCLIPQQVALMASAWSAAFAVLNGHYSDMVVRPREFIFADQWGNIIPALLHTAYVVWVFVQCVMPPKENNASECRATGCILRR